MTSKEKEKLFSLYAKYDNAARNAKEVSNKFAYATMLSGIYAAVSELGLEVDLAKWLNKEKRNS